MALAPDAASVRAGGKLAGSAGWSETGWGAESVWGLCKGSGSKPYQTVVDLASGTPAYKCSCPSRKFPCKHALGLLLRWAGGGPFAEGDAPPDWARPWLDKRRARAASGPAESGGPAAGGGREGGTAARPEAARRRAERRRQRIAAGASELEERLADLLRGGLAGSGRRDRTVWEETAARMVDAQAPGLAARIRELAVLPQLPDSAAAGAAAGAGWPARMLSECALLHLLAQGFLRLDELPEPLAATVRSRVGITVDSAELLADEAARIRDEWLVLAERDTEEGRLNARRIWLCGLKTGRPALLLNYTPQGRQHEMSLPVGASLDAELAFHPGARPLRAVLGERHGAPRPGVVPAGGSVAEALASYSAALCDDPWLDAWPAVLRAVVPVAGEDGSAVGQLADADGRLALPIAKGTPPGALWRLLSASGGRPVTVMGECGHRGFTPYTAWVCEAADGTAGDGSSRLEAVPL